MFHSHPHSTSYLFSHFVILDFCCFFFSVCFAVSVSVSDMRLWMSNSIYCIILKCIWSEIDGSIISYSLNRRCRSSNNIKFVFDGNRIHLQNVSNESNEMAMHQKTKCYCIVYCVIRHTSYINGCLSCPLFNVASSNVFNAQEAIQFTCLIYRFNHIGCNNKTPADPIATSLNTIRFSH